MSRTQLFYAIFAELDATREHPSKAAWKRFWRAMQMNLQEAHQLPGIIEIALSAAAHRYAGRWGYTGHGGLLQ